MQLSELQPTPLDLRWRMFGVPVRVHPLFWLITAMLGWNLFQQVGFQPFVMWILAVFLSILLHELGHVLVGMAFGSRGAILLYSFGGLAIGSTNLPRRWQRIAVMLAGPGVQLALYGGLVALTWTAESVRLTRESPPAAWLLFHLLYINLWWALLNLLPIYPLDGGQIARELLTGVSPRGGARYSLGLSILTAAALAVYALAVVKPPDMFLGLFFVFFGVMNIQELQAESQRGRFPDDPPWMR